MQALRWETDRLILLDQTRLPQEVVYLTCRDYQTVAEAILRLQVRGAPAIGVAAAYGLVLGAQQLLRERVEHFPGALETVAAELRSTRPTAVNLFWALDRMMAVVRRLRDAAPAEITTALAAEAGKMADADLAVNRQLSRHGAALLNDGDTVLTHCNSGLLATVGIGTGLGVIRMAWQQGKRIQVYACETRPLLQGARLTAWELMQDGIPVTLITDSMAAWVMSKGLVRAVIVGADRVAANGDVANKIGTYGLAVLAKYHGIPFYAAVPLSTIDPTLAHGGLIPIEERPPAEVTHCGGRQVAPEGVAVFNPAFDVTPHQLVTAIITEKGVIYPPFQEEIATLTTK